MQALLKIVDGPEGDVRERTVEVSRLPVLGEYVREGADWFEVKRVAHLAHDDNLAGELYAIPIVDPTRERLNLYEWLEPAP